MMPTVVSGLIRPDAALSSEISSVMGTAKSGLVIEYSAHDPEPVWKKVTLFPTQPCRFSPLALTTFPTPSKPRTAGSGSVKSTPSSFNLSTGLTVDASTFIKRCPSFGSGIGLSSRMGSFPV